MSLEIIGNIDKDFNKDEKKVFEILFENLNRNCKGMIFPKYHLMYKNDRDCEIMLFIESAHKNFFELKSKKAFNLMVLIEVKGHYDFVLTQNNEVLVKYKEGPVNAFNQVDISAKKLSNYVNSKISGSTWIYKFIAFPNIRVTESPKELKKAYENAHINKFLLLNEELNLESLTSKCLYQREASSMQNSGFTSFVNFDQYHEHIEKLKLLLSGLEKPIELGLFDRKRVENIANNRIKIDEYLKILDEKNLLITGKAGSGKTIAMIKLAIKFLVQNKKILIITYNTALATDIYRLIVYYFENFNVNMFENIDVKKLFRIINIDQLIWDYFEIAKSWVNASTPNGDYVSKYKYLIQSLNLFIKQLGINESRHLLDFGYNYIFMDEAQDLENESINVVLMLNNNYARIICTDSPDQSLKNSRPTLLDKADNFTERNRNINYRNFRKIQKYSNKINRSLLNKLKGGLISDILDEEFESELGDGNVEIFSDSSLFENNLLLNIINDSEKKGGDRWSILILQSKFDPDRNKLFEYLNFNKIEYWDGHDDNNRKDFKSYPNKVRIIDYESCRGLEGWCVILRNVDIAFSYSYKVTAVNAGFLSEEEKLDRSKKLLYISSSRAIEKLYISYAKEKLIAGALKDLSKNL